MEFSKNSDVIKELISRVKGGDQEAFVLLLDKYRPLIEASVSKFSLDEAIAPYRDDLRQEASLVFYNSVMTYDLEQGEVEFGLYAKICIHNALVSQLRSLKKISIEPVENVYDSLSEGQEFSDPSVEFIEKERLAVLYSVIRKNLSDLEYSVWRFYISGRSAEQIASALKSDKRSVNNAIYRIRKKLRALLG